MTDGLKDAHRTAIIATLAANDRVERAVLFGSRATGTNTVSSDVDIALFGERLTMTDQARLATALDEIPMAQSVDLLLYGSVQDRALREHIGSHGVEWYARSNVSNAIRAEPEQWPTRRFGELLSEPVRNGIYKSKEHHGHGVKIVNMGEIFTHSRLHAIPMRRVALSESEVQRFAVARGDLLFARRSLVAEGAGKCCVVLDVDETTAFESSIIRARLDAEASDPLYYYYFFCSPSGLHCLDTIRRQVAVAGITGKDLSELRIPVPQVGEQRAIAHILSTLDDKIELTRRMNATLESMARALFRSWFVDFEPVRAKMEGRNTRLPKDVADLFPDRLVDSELGQIPHAWKVLPLADVANVTKGRSYRRNELAASDTALVTLKSFARGGGYRPEGLKSFRGAYKEEHVVRPGEVILACTDVTQAAEVIGRSALVEASSAYHTLVASLDVLILRPRSAAPRPTFLYYLTGTENFVAHTFARTTGTTVLHLSRDAVPGFRFALPPPLLMERFEHLAESLRARIQDNASAAQYLAELRDTLIPRLVSGELRVTGTDEIRARY